MHLTSQLEKTEKQCSSHSESLKRVKAENSQLVQRCNYLEEQLSEHKNMHEKDMAEEKKAHKAYVVRSYTRQSLNYVITWIWALILVKLEISLSRFKIRFLNAKLLL